MVHGGGRSPRDIVSVAAPVAAQVERLQQALAKAHSRSVLLAEKLEECRRAAPTVVWLLGSDDNRDYMLFGIYATEELAQAARNALPESTQQYVEVNSYEVLGEAVEDSG